MKSLMMIVLFASVLLLTAYPIAEQSTNDVPSKAGVLKIGNIVYEGG